MATLIDILKQFNPKGGLIKSAFLSMVENFYLYKITNLEKISGKQKPTQKTFKLKKLFRKNLSNSNSCINKTKQKTILRIKENIHKKVIKETKLTLLFSMVLETKFKPIRILERLLTTRI
jgi:hypothetical protein